MMLLNPRDCLGGKTMLLIPGACLGGKAMLLIPGAFCLPGRCLGYIVPPASMCMGGASVTSRRALPVLEQPLACSDCQVWQSAGPPCPPDRAYSLTPTGNQEGWVDRAIGSRVFCHIGLPRCTPTYVYLYLRLWHSSPSVAGHFLGIRGRA